MRNSLDMTPPGSPSLYKAFLRPNWFIQRENGAYVPVIPVDELPPDIDLEGAPRSLKMEDAQGMKFLEKLPFNGQTYSLATTAAALPKFEFNPAVHTRPLPPSGREPDQTKKEYCTYWIKTGECDFMQQGCLFKHEMPDLKTLREKVGIHSVPHWYQVKSAMTRRNTNSRTLTKPPSWLQQRVVTADQRAAHSDDSGSESEEEVAKSMRENRKMLLPAPPAPSTPSTTKATAGPAVSFGFRAPDHNVRHTAKRSLESHAVLSLMKPNAQLKTKEEQEGTAAACATEIIAPEDNDQQNLIDFSTSPPIDRDASTLTSLADLTAPAPGSKAANKKKAPSTRRATFLPAGDTLPPTRRRSISDTQADIFNLIRATSHDSGRHSRASHRSTQSTCAKPSIRSTTAIKHKPTTTTKANMKSYFPSTGPISSSAPPATAIPSPAAKKPPSATTTTTTSPAAATPSTPASGYASSSDTSDDGGNASSPAFSRTSSATTTSTTASAIPKLATPRPSRPASASSGLAVAPAPALPAKPKHRRAASAVTKKSWPPLGGLQASRHAAGRAEEEGEGEDVPSFEPHTVVTARGGGAGRGRVMTTMTAATTTGRGRRAGGTRVPVKVGGKVAMGAGGEA
ncbi:putative c-x8-c-x5-c-x3-h type zinc finger protein [Neofusicoccum parvum]|nr:putative c-x8-c-x5-c-x3-h type zinc finger protein [Neofusicoccum parvum]